MPAVRGDSASPAGVIGGVGAILLAMNGHRRLLGLLGGLAALSVGSLPGQDVGAPPDARLTDWLAVRPEGAISGVGLAECYPASGKLTRILEAGHVTGIAVAERRIFAVSDQGLLEVDTSGDSAELVRRWLVLPPAAGGEPVPIVVRTDLRAP